MSADAIRVGGRTALRLETEYEDFMWTALRAEMTSRAVGAIITGRSRVLWSVAYKSSKFSG